MPRLVRAFVSPEELDPTDRVSYEEVAALAAALNRDEALHFLGFVNLLLSVATLETYRTRDMTAVRDVQLALVGQVLSTHLLARLHSRFGMAFPVERPLLHRSQVLFSVRLVATHATVDGGNRLQTRPDFDAIGDLLFRVNGLFLPEPRGGASIPLWLAAQMGPLNEVESPSRLDVAWPRVRRLLTDHLPAAADDQALFGELESVALFGSGFNPGDWLDLNFMLSSFWTAVPFTDLMQNRGRAYLDFRKDHETISQALLERALSTLGVAFEAVPTTLSLPAPFSRAFLYDLTPFRRTPIWLMPNATALCIDASMITERLSAFAYWNAMTALDTEVRRLKFSSWWGAAFERASVTALRSMFLNRRWEFVANPRHPRSGDELWDAAARRLQSAAVVVECKGTFVKASAKYSGVPLDFFRGLTRKFGHKRRGAIQQLARGIVSTWGVSSAPELQDWTRVQDVFAIVVAQDPIVNSGPVVRLLSDRFDRAVKRRRLRPHVRVWPLTVLSADALDILNAVVSVTGEPIHQILKTFHRRSSSRMTLFEDYLGSDPNRFMTKEVRELINARFHEVADATMQRFESQAFRVQDTGRT